MRKNTLLLTTLATTLLISPGVFAADDTKPVVVKKKTMLFNGKNLDGLVGYLPKKEEIAGNWSASDGVLKCDGKPVGYIRTKNLYANYKLHVEWRWPEKPGNSGVLLHLTGKDQSFPNCIEAQLKSGNAGMLVMMSGGAFTVDGKRIVAKKFAAAKQKNPSNEKPAGEWNSYDIVCNKGMITVTVNGLKQNAGIKADPASGHIALQSEGAPIEFRNVYVEAVD
jgi:hypothetical protein